MTTTTLDCETYIAAKTSILRIQDLTLGERVLLMRIASFPEYFESAEHCAEEIGFTASTVKKMKRVLEEKGYVICVANSGRGKRYIAREDLRTHRKDEPVEKEVKVDTSMLRPVKSQSRKTGNPWKKWKEQNPDLVPALDACTNYLAWRQIPLLDPAKLRKQLKITADLFRDPDKPNYHVQMITSYIEYLESDAYAYQAEHTKFCPIITSQDDLFRKFSAVREFKWDTSRHYDPSKVLTR